MQSLFANLQPVQSENSVRFVQNKPLELLDQNISAPSVGYHSGKTAMTQSIMDGILSAVGSLTGAYTKKRKEDQDKADAQSEQSSQDELLKKLSELLQK